MCRAALSPRAGAFMLRVIAVPPEHPLDAPSGLSRRAEPAPRGFRGDVGGTYEGRKASVSPRRHFFRWPARPGCIQLRSEEHTSELQSLMRISYAVFCLKKKTTQFLERLRRTSKNY